MSATAVGDVLAWMEHPSHEHGIEVRSARGSDRRTYADLAADARGVASGLRRLGVDRENRVLTVLPGRSEFVTSFFGVLGAGATITPVAPRGAWRGRDEYRGHVRRVVEAVEPRLVVTDARHREDFVELLAGRAPVVTMADVVAASTSAATVERAETALLQFTSGSSAAPRGVRISHRALAANVTSIQEWLDLRRHTASAHWMPFHHDMGLIGGLVLPAVVQGDLWSLGPGDFLRDPLGYLRLFDGNAGARIGTMPNFGLEQVIARVAPADLAGLDLSGCRAMVLGAERIDPDVLGRFAALLAPTGFRGDALRPAYGLAEATLAVTGGRGEPRITDLPSTEGGDARRPVHVVGCGRPLAGVTVSVLSEAGEPLPEGQVGEILVRATSLGSGYAAGGHSDHEHATRFTDDGLLTGDAGFLLDGELFPIGRLGDSIKVHGRAVFAQDLELVIRELGVPSHSVAVLVGSHAGRNTAVAVLEEPPEGMERAVCGALRDVVPGVDVEVVCGTFPTVERTTSGKPRRRQMWRRYASGELVGVVAARHEATPDPGQ